MTQQPKAASAGTWAEPKPTALLVLADGTVLEGFGLGAPGLIERATGRLLFAPNLRWRDVPLRGPLAGRYRVPVYVDNEANAAALGEQFLGVARQARGAWIIAAPDRAFLCCPKRRAICTSQV